MYEYRNMSPLERSKELDYRKQRGFPLHAPYHLEAPERWYLITAATFEHQPHFRTTSSRTFLENLLLACVHQSRIPLAAWVLLPNHYHLLVYLNGGAADFVPIAHKVHKESSFLINKWHETKGRKVWYRFSDRMIRSARHYQAAINYIHLNPQKHGWCEDYHDWKWSSVHLHTIRHGEAEEEKLMKSYDLSDMGKGWDDL